MPKVCAICGKGPVFGNSVSHSHKATKRKWNPNLQRIKAATKSGTKRLWVKKPFNINYSQAKNIGT
jgi:large subunit ribosomal protein L28